MLTVLEMQNQLINDAKVLRVQRLFPKTKIMTGTLIHVVRAPRDLDSIVEDNN